MTQERKDVYTGLAGEALVQFRRTKFNGTAMVYADVEDDHGIVVETVADAERVSVKAPNVGGTDIMVASGAISAGADVYPDTDGKITATVQGRRIGVAFGDAATADGDEIEVLRLPGNVIALRSAVLDHASFTDGGGTSGSIDTALDVPAGYKVLGFKADVTEAFVGDTTGTLELGDGSDADRFCGATNPDMYAIATVNSEAPAGIAHCLTAQNVIATITGTADWTSVTAGKVRITVFCQKLQ